MQRRGSGLVARRLAACPNSRHRLLSRDYAPTPALQPTRRPDLPQIGRGSGRPCALPAVAGRARSLLAVQVVDDPQER
jgi:hypothetical protein